MQSKYGKLFESPINKCEKLFGLANRRENLCNFILLCAHKHVYDCNLNNKQPNIHSMDETLKYYEKIERIIAEDRNKIIQHLIKWDPFNNEDNI